MSTDLAVIEAALKAATPGPWWWRNTQDPMLLGGRTMLVMSFERMGMQGAQPLFRDAHNIMQPAGRANINEFADAHLIANAPSWLAELVERVKVAEAAIERVRALADRLKAGGFTSVYESAQELGEMIDEALDGDAKRCTSDITLRDEEHHLCRCTLTEGHAGVHDDGAGTTWTGGDA